MALCKLLLRRPDLLLLDEVGVSFCVSAISSMAYIALGLGLGWCQRLFHFYFVYSIHSRCRRRLMLSCLCSLAHA